MKKLLHVLIIFCLSECSYALEGLERGVGINSENKDTLWNSSIPYAVARQGLRSVADNEYIVAFQKVDDYVLGLSNTARLLKVQTSDRSLLASWLLIRWEHEFIEEEVEAAFYYGRQWPGTQEYFGDLTGCMAKTPMRYGDFSGDGNSEIILFLPDEFTLYMLVFSPEKGKVIFSSPISTTNSIAIDEADQSLLHPDSERHYQYYLRSGQVIAGMGGAMTPAIRAYGKVYIDDFNKDDRPDLLLWRKLYRSLPTSNQAPGFEKLREVWLHYALVDGEYQRQDTSESIIQGWLTANDLTWRKGFPSNSECAGEEGELIPEMHDPLLNDPDVLK